MLFSLSLLWEKESHHSQRLEAVLFSHSAPQALLGPVTIVPELCHTALLPCAYTKLEGIVSFSLSVRTKWDEFCIHCMLS